MLFFSSFVVLKNASNRHATLKIKLALVFSRAREGGVKTYTELGVQGGSLNCDERVYSYNNVLGD
jgi:hypothetical protein